MVGPEVETRIVLLNLVAYFIAATNTIVLILLPILDSACAVI
jgi:hypothetical protein